MKRFLPWLGLGLLTAAFGGAFACSSSDSGGGSGKSTGGTAGGGGTVIGGGGTGGTSGSGGGGTSGTGGTKTDSGVKRLGRACATDAECGQGLTCKKADTKDFDNEGPGKGYCTADCSADANICAQFDPTSVCLTFDNKNAFCFEGCTFGPDDLKQFDSKKCHGRPEVACRPGFDSSGNFTQPYCFPQCNSDADCGGSLKCNPRTGLCGTTTPTGKSLGEKCVQDLDGGTNECKGHCIGFVHAGSGSGATPFTYMCAENCTVGAAPSCGWGGPGTGPAPAACLYSLVVISENGGPGIGDLGSCAQLCDCNADCKNPDMVCSAWPSANAADLQKVFGKKGICGDPQDPDGGPPDPGIATCSGTGGTGGGGTGGGGTGGTGTGGAGGASDAATD